MAIVADNRVVECGYLLDWLQVSLTLQPGLTRGATAPPANFMGETAQVFPALDEDEHLQRHRWSILCRDHPALDTSHAVSVTDQMNRLVGGMRLDRQLERQNDEARQVADKDEKFPTATKFKHTAI